MLQETVTPPSPAGLGTPESGRITAAGLPVRVGIEAIAIATDEEGPEELLEVTTEAAKMSIIGKEQAVEQVERGISRGYVGNGRCRMVRRWRRLPGTRLISPEGSTRPHTSSKRCRRGGPAVSLPWPGWTWTDRRGAKGRILTPLARKGVL